jgi:hypothetical protein
MTVGGYPEDVPQQWRLDADRLDTSTGFPQFKNVSSLLGIDTFSTSGGAIADDFDFPTSAPR